jgi:hypothetical protein
MTKVLSATFAVMSLTLSASLVLADGNKGNKNNGGQNQNQSNSQGQSGNKNQSSNSNSNSDSKFGSNNKSSDSNSNSNNKNSDSNSSWKMKSSDSNSNKKNSDSSSNSNKKNSNSNGSSKFKLGDIGFDKNGIGRMDDKKFSNDKDKNNKERFQKHGKEWWYWTHSGQWRYWRGGQWCDYDQDTYVDIGGARGPFYEDQNGFFSLDDGRKIYDPQIHRYAGEIRGPVGSFAVPGGPETTGNPAGLPPGPPEN